MTNREFFNFNHRITFQKEVQTSGEFGEIVSSWADVKTVWAKIEPSGYNQNTSRMKNDVEVSYTIVVRFDEELKGCKRILFGERVFKVLSAMCMNESREFLTFFASELDESLND